MDKQFEILLQNNADQPTVKLVYEYLHKKIITHAIEPGKKISFAKIANEIEVSRATVRAAVLLLEKVNLIEKVPNLGFCVAPLTISEMHELYITRKIIESGAAKILCESITNSQKKHFNDMLKTMDKAMRENDYEGFAYADFNFHKSIVEFSNARYIINMYNSVSDIILRYIMYTAYPKSKTTLTPLMLHQHKIIVASIKLGIPSNVQEQIEKHITDAERSLMFPNYQLTI